ncbi:MAG: aminotransferase class IV [Candidatus Hydrothermae bacterium]|nr:aminotransferase class IV [Candidatus Hydrothermae bacterium]
MTRRVSFTVVPYLEGWIPLWELHLDRLRYGAMALTRRRLPRAALRRRLDEVLCTLPLEATLRLRILVPAAGTPVLEPQPLRWVYPDWGLRRVQVVTFHPSGSPWKTGDWTPYHQAHARARAAGADEALLVYPDGRVISLARANLLAYRDGCWETPPLSAGVISGVMRRLVYRVLRTSRTPLHFRELTLKDLHNAEVVAGMNSVRLLMPLHLGHRNLEPLRALWNLLEPHWRQGGWIHPARSGS